MIEIKDFAFQYREGTRPVVSGINLTIPDGAFVGITGAAGSGKSTLTYALNGIVPHCYPGDFYGSVVVDGLDTCETALTDLSRVVGSVCQDVDSQFVTSVVEDEVLYGLENFAVPRDQMEGRVAQALADMGISDLRDRVISSLSGGQKQKVAIASILAMRPKVLVLDEPTAELDPASSRSVFELLCRLRARARHHRRGGGAEDRASVPVRGLAGHRGRGPHPLRRRAGRRACARRRAQAHRRELPALDHAHEPPARVGRVRRARGPYRAGSLRGPGGGGRMIEFKDVHASYDAALPILKGVSFAVERGEFVAFVGTNGAGKSTTMRLVNGLLKPDSGQVLVDGVPTTELKTSELARTVGFLFQNPDRQICCNTVREELLFGFKALGMEGPEADARVDALIEDFGFDPNEDPFLMNRGARQLLALASIVVLAPPVVVLDEPTTGLDYRECVKVMDIVGRMHEGGATVIMVCHDMEVVADYAERCIVMSDGAVVDDGPTFEVLRNRATLERASLVPPQIVDVSLELTRLVPRLAGTAVAKANTVDEMAAAIVAASVGSVDEGGRR